MKKPLYPSLYQINTRVWLTELSQELGRKATLDDIPDSELDRFAEMGFDWIWLLSVWTTGLMGQKISRQQPDWVRDYEVTLPDLKQEDIAGSGFAIADYHVSPDLGGDVALKRLRERLQKYGLKLVLDFVPNHMGPDHPWVEDHPDYFVKGKEQDLETFPQNFFKKIQKQGDLIFAYGRDPYFSGWPDTVQLDYSNQETVEAMTRELVRISDQCDDLRCDMAMLVLPEIFEKTWGHKAFSFWPELINLVRKKHADFCFMAEVYWDMEWTLQQLGFDYTYDKRLYDRLEEGQSRAVRQHLYAALDYQNKMVRFLENHDESRAASTFEPDQQKAAAIITYLSPGLRFFHQGQFEGRKKRISPHLVRAPREQVDRDLQEFYNKLFSVLNKSVFRDGHWELLSCEPAWEGNGTWDSFLAFSWEGPSDIRTLVVVNYAGYHGQCLVRLPFSDMEDHSFIFTDMMGKALFNRDGSEILASGLYIDLPEWGYHIFDVRLG